MFETLRKSVEMLPPGTRGRWFMLVPLAIVTGAAEMGAAAGIFALVSLLTASPAPSRWFAPIVARLPWHGPQAIVLQVCVLLAVYSLLKALLTIWAEYMRIRISHDASAQLASAMLRRYLSAPYPFHFHRNSAELVRNCTDSVAEVLGGVLAASTKFIADLCMGAGVIVVLVLTSPWPALASGLMLVATMWGVLRITRRAATRHGAHSYDVSVGILKSVQQALGGIKEVKVLGRERYFYEDFELRQRELRELGDLQVALRTAPPVVMQTALLYGGLALVGVLVLTGRTGAETLPVASVFGYAGIRVLPLAQGLIVTLNGIRERQRWVDELYDDYRALDDVAMVASAPDPIRLTFTHEIRLERVSYTYPGADRPALVDVSLAIHHGESIGIVGSTGSGKSTVVDLVLGLLTPTRGAISVDGVPLTANAVWTRRVGYVPQTLFLIDDTLRRNIALGIPDAEIDDRRMFEVLRMSQFAHVIADLPRGLDTRVGERGVRLSGGERQRVAIARALYHDPDLIVFDEATSSLDVLTEGEITRAIEALRGFKTMLVVAHRLSTLRGCDRLVWLCEGRVEAIGSFDDLCRQHAEFGALARAAV
jgi:ATP-binding cassette, subfamily B, bacterial PglK